MPWDDRAKASCRLDVAEQVKVLVVGAETAAGGGPRARSAAFYFQAALAPFGASSHEHSAAIPWSIDPAYRGIDELVQSPLGDFAAIYLCDVPRITAAAADALATYAHGGGRIVWILGPSIDSTAYNQILLGSNRTLLPLPLGQPLVTGHRYARSSGSICIPASLLILFDSEEPFRSVLVTGRWSFAGDAKEISGENATLLAKLADDIPLASRQTLPATQAVSTRC